MIILNSIVAKQLKDFKIDVDKIIETGVKKDEAIFRVLKTYIIESKTIRFEGNGYGDEWIAEAEKRGLTNIKDMVEAIKHFVTPESVALFDEMNILTHRELKARLDIRQEIFIKKIQIESRVLGDLTLNHIIPTAIKYQNVLIENVRGLKEVLPSIKNTSQLKVLEKISNHIFEIENKVGEMTQARKDANNIAEMGEKAEAYNKNVKPFLDKIRYHIDKLELIVDDEIWPLPKYRELLFTR
jgi:glutamine synthetase